METPVDEVTDETDNEVIQPLTAEPLMVAEPLVVEELLVEEISIDGMCGVY